MILVTPSSPVYASEIAATRSASISARTSSRERYMLVSVIGISNTPCRCQWKCERELSYVALCRLRCFIEQAAYEIEDLDRDVPRRVIDLHVSNVNFLHRPQCLVHQGHRS